ncbi:MAG: PAS domain-containing protein [Balneolia bacterium]|nr:PAS domain-containing protein [Balneolia bacterium]
MASKSKKNSPWRILEETETLARTGSWELNLKTDELICTNGVYHILDTEPGSFDINFKKGFEIVHPDDRDMASAHMREVLEKGVEYNIRKRLLTPGGKIKHVVSRAHVIRDESGEAIKLTGVFRDITSEVEENLKLRDIKNHLEQTIHSVNGIIWEASAKNLQTTYVSPQSENILGYKPEMFLTKAGFWKSLLHPDDADAVLAKSQKAADTATGTVLEYRIRNSEGTYIWLQDSLSPVIGNGKCIGLRGLMRDITPQKQTSELYNKSVDDLRKSERRFRALVQDGSDLTAAIKKDGFYGYTTPNYYNLLGYTSEELKDINAYSLVHPDDAHKLKALVKDLEPGERVKFDKYRFRDKQGKWRWMQSVCTNLLNEQSIEGYIVNSTDITDLIETQLTLKESNDRFNLINKATNDAIYDWDIIEDRFIWGDGFKRIFGHDTTGRIFRMEDWAELEHPSDKKKFHLEWKDFLDDPEQFKWQNGIRIRKGDGAYAYIEEIGHMIRDKAGKPVRMIGAIRDVSEHKQQQIRNEMQQHISRMFAQSHSSKQALHELTEYLTDYGDFGFCEVWLKGQMSSSLNLAASYASGKPGELFQKASSSIKSLIQYKKP